jgi:hypothetical protein
LSFGIFEDASRLYIVEWDVGLDRWSYTRLGLNRLSLLDELDFNHGNEGSYIGI